MQPSDGMEPEEVKADVYEAMAVINRAFQQVAEGLARLQKCGVLAEDWVFDQGLINSEVCARINCHILARVTEREQDDRNHYGKMRAALSKRRG